MCDQYWEASEIYMEAKIMDQRDFLKTGLTALEDNGMRH